MKDFSGKDFDNFSREDFMFDYCVGNPPYQAQSGGKRHQVYSQFWVFSWNFAASSIMIFPVGWQTSTGRASGSNLHKGMRGDKKLIEVDNYYEDKKKSPVIVFPHMSTMGVSVVVRDVKRLDSHGVEFKEYGKLIDSAKDMTVVQYWSDRTDDIFTKISSWMDANSIKGCDAIVTGRNPFGMPNGVANSGEFMGYKFLTDKTEGTIPCISNVPHKGMKTVYVPDNTPGLRLSNVHKYKVCWKKFGAWSSWRWCFVSEPGVALSDSFLCASFDTRKDAENYLSYFVTLFYRFVTSESAPNMNAMRGIHKYCPNLSTVKNPRTSKTGWESDWTDDDLKELFKDYLSEDDWEYIERTALESDGDRR